MAKTYPLSGIRKWLERAEWAEPFDELLDIHLEDACAAAGIEVQELPDVIGDALASNLFNCVFDDMLASELEDGRNILDDYLKRRGWKESVPNKRYMAALRSSVMSLYEVSEVVPNRSFLARDMLRGGDPVLVSEKLATRGMKPWDLVGARFVTLGETTEMAGGALPFARRAGEGLRERFVEMRERMRALDQSGAESSDGALDPYARDTEVLRVGASLFTSAWLEGMLREVLHPVRPELINSDRDTIEITTVRYPLKPEADRKALADGLAAIPGLDQRADDRWDWVEPPAKPSGDAVLWARLELEGNTLKLEANSAQRVERARALLDPVIAPFVGEPVVTAATVDEMAASRTAGEKRSPRNLSPEEERTFVHEALERHYRTLLDSPVPALGEVSPRESAKTTEGRERLAGWLKGLENANARHEPGSPFATYDVSWLWKELGVSDLRR